MDEGSAPRWVNMSGIRRRRRLPTVRALRPTSAPAADAARTIHAVDPTASGHAPRADAPAGTISGTEGGRLAVRTAPNHDGPPVDAVADRDVVPLLRALLVARRAGGPTGHDVDPWEGVLVGTGHAVTAAWARRGTDPLEQPWVLPPLGGDALAVGLGATADELVLARLGRRVDPGRGGRGHGAPAIPRLRLVGVVEPDAAVGAGLALGARQAAAARVGATSPAAVPTVPVVVIDLAGTPARLAGLAVGLGLARIERLPLVVVVPAAGAAAAVARAAEVAVVDVDGDDVEAVVRVVTAALGTAAAGEPVVVAARPGVDPAGRLAGTAGARGLVDADGAARLGRSVEGEVAAAVATGSEAPPPSPVDLLGHVVDRAIGPLRGVPEPLARVGDRSARPPLGAPDPREHLDDDAAPVTLLEALDGALGRRERVDTRHLAVAVPGAAGGALVDVALGAALAGARPVVRLDGHLGAGALHDALPALSRAAAIRWRSAGAWSAPLLVVGPEGAAASAPERPATGGCASIPGLVVTCVATPADAEGLVASLAAWPDPAVVLVPAGAPSGPPAGPGHHVAPGRARTARQGTDATVVTWGAALPAVLGAAENLAAHGVGDVEVVDLRTLAPIDVEALAASVARTGRFLVVGDEPPSGSLGDAVRAQLVAACLHDLDAPPGLLSLPDLPALPPGDTWAAVLGPTIAAVEAAVAALLRA
jgi:pyruvate/2-oxoglutarate/acetoin dehydrogenase E1 component